MVKIVEVEVEKMSLHLYCESKAVNSLKENKSKTLIILIILNTDFLNFPILKFIFEMVPFNVLDIGKTKMQKIPSCLIYKKSFKIKLGHLFFFSSLCLLKQNQYYFWELFVKSVIF